MTFLREGERKMMRAPRGASPRWKNFALPLEMERARGTLPPAKLDRGL
jgi:hypothetical protein